MTEQERADRLSQEIDRLLDGATTPDADPLLKIAQRLSDLPLQDSVSAAERFESQLNTWFATPRAVQPRMVTRRWALTGLAAILVAILGVGLLLTRLNGVVPPMTAVANLPTMVATAMPTLAPTGTPSPLPDTATPSPAPRLAANCGVGNIDDSDDLPVVLNISGNVQAVNTATVQINDLNVQVPAEAALPPLEIGKTATIPVKLCNNDTLIALAPSAVVTPTLPQATLNALGTPLTALPTLPATRSGCDQAQPLASVIASTYDVPYTEVVDWYCRGITYGVIARAYLLTNNGQATNIETVIALRTNGNGWNSIVQSLQATRTSANNNGNGNNGNNGNDKTDCNALKKANSPLYDQLCKKGNNSNPTKEPKPTKDNKPPKK